MHPSPEEIQAAHAEADLLITATEIEQAMQRMAEEITGALADSNPLILCVMLGGLVPAGQLLPRLDFPLQIDYIHVTRYHGGTRGKELQWIKTPDEDLQGRTILIIDDILDEGLTLAALVDACRNAGAEKVYTAVLVEKERERPADVARADFTGVVVEDRYVYGYGMDYRTYLRNAAGIYAVKDL